MPTSAPGRSPTCPGYTIADVYRVLFGQTIREYVDAVDAPVKEFVSLPGVGHMPMLIRPDLFLGELLARVRPLAAA